MPSLPRGIAARDVLVRIEVVVEPYIVFHIALGAPIDSSTEVGHPRIDRRRPVLAHVSDDGRLAGAKNKAGLAGCLIASICASQIRGNANHASCCRADRCSPSGAHRCASRSRKQAQQGANAYANAGSQGRMRLSGIDLEIAQGITMDHRRSVYSDFGVVVELPERVQTFVSLACIVKDHSDIITHGILLFGGFSGYNETLSCNAFLPLPTRSPPPPRR